MRGWRLPGKILWSILLGENVTADYNINTKTAIANTPPSNLLRIQPLPPSGKYNDTDYQSKHVFQLTTGKKIQATLPLAMHWMHCEQHLEKLHTYFRANKRVC